MTKAKHTPGPWVVPDQTWRRSLTVEVGGKELVQCPGSGGAMSYTETICTLNWSRTPEWDANARLIAAAPDLLEALEALVEQDFGAKGWNDTCERAALHARAAIAKAKE